MEFAYLTLNQCAEATGTVVVIDVLRAFTCTAFALAAGAEEIVLVGEPTEAFALREQMPGAKLMGEAGGSPIPGFDFSNSPAGLVDLDTARMPDHSAHKPWHARGGALDTGEDDPGR